MIKWKLLLAALIAAAALTTPAMARQSQVTSQRFTANANARIASGQGCCGNRASDSRGFAERDVWGHWGAYYGPLVH